MSLLDRGPHAVTVTPKVKSEGAYGDRLVDGDPVRVERVTVQDFNATYEVGAEGNAQVSADIVIYGRGDWPGGPHSTIRVEAGGHAGLVFDQVGIPKRYETSPRTAHYRVLASVRSVGAR